MILFGRDDISEYLSRKRHAMCAAWLNEPKLVYTFVPG
jgi:hypothetical protein